LFDSIPSDTDHKDYATIANLFKEISTDVLKAKLKKYWLEDFYQFCIGIGGDTARVMDHILKFEADIRTIQILYNSYSNKYKSEKPGDLDSTKLADRKTLCNKFG